MVFGTPENHILHLTASQLFGTLLPHTPSDCVHHIAFSAAVWPDDPADSGGKCNVNLVHKRFEAEYGERFDFHDVLHFSIIPLIAWIWMVGLHLTI